MKYYRIEDLLADCFVLLDQYGIKKINAEAIVCYNEAIEEYLKSANIKIEYMPVSDEKTYLEDNFADYFSLVQYGNTCFYVCHEDVSKFDLIYEFYGKTPTDFHLASSTVDAFQALMFIKHKVKNHEKEILIGRQQLIRDRFLESLGIDEDLFSVHSVDKYKYREELVKKLAIEYRFVVEDMEQNERKELLADMLEVIFSISESYGITKDELLAKGKELKEELGGYQKRLYLEDIC